MVDRHMVKKIMDICQKNKISFSRIYVVVQIYDIMNHNLSPFVRHVIVLSLFLSRRENKDVVKTWAHCDSSMKYLFTL